MSGIEQILSNNEEYKSLINSLLQRVKQTRMQTAIGVNSQLIRLYWSIGKDIVKMQENERYGDALIYQLSEDLQREFPDIKGFSYRNIHYMKNMYLLFKQVDINLPQLVADSLDENRKFYARHKMSESKKAKKQKLRVFYRQRLKDLRFRAFFAKGQDLRFREK